MQNDKKQRQMKEQINMYMRKKDYYDILGLSKNCTQTQIKKAYKKLALRFHPDKNSVEGAKQVFKKVSQAYTTLVNTQKRAEYQRYGPQQDRQPQFRPRYNANHHPQDQFEQVFRAFFGGVNGNHRNNHYTYTFNMGGRNRQQNQNRPGNANAQNNFSFMHVFILISILYIVPLFFRDRPAYSMTPDYEYKVKIQTQIFRIPFYVRTQTVKQLQQSNKYWRNINQKVQTQYLYNLYKECQIAQRRRRNYEMQAYRYNPGAQRQRLLLKARRQDMSSCRKFSQLRDNYGEYVRKLLDYY